MKNFILILLFNVLHFTILAQEEVKVSANEVDLYGTFLAPELRTSKAILLIAGSGPTDRDGNTKPMYVNDGLKKLAQDLAREGYAVLRYDKRGIGKSISDTLKAENLRFEQYVADASRWITFLKDKYEDITVIGHSQGALVGMLAIQENEVNRFISLAGMSEDVYSTVKRQLKNQPQFVMDASYPILDSLKEGIKVDSVPAYLYSLFNPKIQDYFISFMKYNPREEIKKLNCPILVIQGSSDLQITVEGAREMSNEAHFAKLKVIDSMNHVLRKSSMEVSENLGTYSNPDLPLHKELLEVILTFLSQDYWYEPFYTLLGKWQVNGKQQFEEWQFNKEKEILEGTGYKIIGNEKQLTETLEIKNVNDRIIYTSTVPTQNNGKGIEFTLNPAEPQSWLFENANHDFPNKILYTTMGTESINVEISGKNEKGFILSMQKVKD